MSPSLPGTVAGLATLAVTAAALTVPSAAAGPDAKATAAPAAAKTTTVTLLTGDVVTLTDTGAGPDTVSVDRASGSAGGYQTYTVGDDLHVVPDAALAVPRERSRRRRPLQRHRLGRAGVRRRVGAVDPADRPVRTRRPRRRRGRAGPQHPRSGAAEHRRRRRRREQGPGGRLLGRDRQQGRARFAGGIAKIHLDGKVERLARPTPSRRSAPPRRGRQGLDGTGVTVAVLDTGVDQTHPDLAEQVAETRSFVPGETVTDVNGHGTHVASTVAGTGAASDGKEKGVAPGADLAIGKVLNDAGSGAESWIIEGMEWGAGRADVVSMSLGSPEASDGTDPMALAVDSLSESTGALFVIAAGNYGRVSGIGSPGAAQSALTVGAVDGADERAYFQDMGPRLGDAVVKPEIVAPGVDVLAARSSASGGDGPYVSLSGTSMATPHVAGAAAIIAQQHPDWTGAQIRDALVSTAKPLEGQTAYQVGGGRLDVPSAAFGDVVATASVELGYHAWPSDDDAPVDRTITYTNLTDADVTLDLSEAVTADDLSPAPEPLVTLSANQVTVPAGGTADVTLTGTPAAGAAGTTYSGTIVASAAGEQVAQTAVGLVKEQERYDLQVRALDRKGKPTGGFVTLYRYGDQNVSTLELDPATGTAATQRLQPGVYNVTSWLPVDADGSGVALVGNPHLVVGGADQTVTLDARKAKEIAVSTPRPSIDSARRPGYVHDSGIGGPYASFVNQYAVSPAIDHVYTAPTGKVDGGRFEFAMRWRRTAPLLSVTAGSQELDARNMPSARRWDGTARLTAVAAGTGTAGDFAGKDVRGKAVLVQALGRHRGVRGRRERRPRRRPRRRDRQRPPGPVHRVRRRHRPADPGDDAGRGAAPDRQAGTWRQGHADARRHRAGALRLRPGPLVRRRDPGRPVVGSREEGPGHDHEPLRRRGRAARDREPGRLLGLELAAVHGSTSSRSTSAPSAPTTSARRTGSVWYEGVQDVRGWELRGDQRSYRRGEVRTHSWFDPVARPRTGPGYWQPRRSGNFFAVNVPFASAGSDGVTGGMSDESTVVTRLYAGDELIDESPFQAVQRGGAGDRRLGGLPLRDGHHPARPLAPRDAYVDGVGLPGADERVGRLVGQPAAAAARLRPRHRPGRPPRRAARRRSA